MRLSPRNDGSYTHKIFPTSLPKYEPNKDNNNSHAEVDGGKLEGPQLYTKNYR